MFRILSRKRDELLMSSLLDDLAVPQYYDAVGAGYRRQAMSHHHDRQLVPDIFEGILYQTL